MKNIVENVEVVIVGSGISGLICALSLAEKYNVLILTKGNLKESNTRYAQGGIASVMNHDTDSFSSHIKDTLEAGAGLCHEDCVEEIVKSAPEAIKHLEKLGINFDAMNGKPELGLEGGHSSHRIMHIGDHTGFSIIENLVDQVIHHSKIRIREHVQVVDLICDEQGCHGVHALDLEHGHQIIYCASFTILASGGIGKVYKYSTNPSIATGDGIAAAFRAGAKVANMEFVQFHPTALYHSEADSFLISEALRGAGAVLKLENDFKFMDIYHPQGSLAPRDVVSQAIANEMFKLQVPNVFLDARHISSFILKNKFPTIFQKCLSIGIDINKKMIPVTPAAHYLCGGIVASLSGKTSIKNLLVLGESACTGMHGANRLASNSLLEAIVMAKNASKVILDETMHRFQNMDQFRFHFSSKDADHRFIKSYKLKIQELTTKNAGILRMEEQLEDALVSSKYFLQIATELFHENKLCMDTIELRNLAQISFLIIKSALLRKESRGVHLLHGYSKDEIYWKHDTVLSKSSKLPLLV